MNTRRGSDISKDAGVFFDSDPKYAEKALGSFWKQRFLRNQFMKCMAFGLISGCSLLGFLYIPNRLNPSERRNYTISTSKKRIETVFDDNDLMEMKDRMVKKVYKTYDSQSSMQLNSKRWI